MQRNDSDAPARAGGFISRHASGLVQTYIWCLMGAVPLIFAFQEMAPLWDILISWLLLIGTLMTVFYVNYWLLIPRLLFRHRKAAFFLSNVGVYLLLTLLLMFSSLLFGSSDSPGEEVETPTIAEYVASVIVLVGGYSLFVLTALALRSFRRAAQFELRQTRQEEELARLETERLKSQLNPHFIFNSLNNISALVDIDPAQAQKAISRLSFMMRHVLEQGGVQYVPLQSEVDFLRDYMELMRLRYTDSLRLRVCFPSREECAAVSVPPMLFISLIENAFKHGADSTVASSVDVEMMLGGDTVTFRVVNSLLPEERANSVPSSGVGLENLRRRLQILFPCRHTISCAPRRDRRQYIAVVTIPIAPCHE